MNAPNYVPQQAWLDGRLVPFAEAVVPITDRGLLLGDSCFETLPVLRGHPFRLSQHLDRLMEGLAFAHFEGLPKAETLATAARELIAAEIAAGSPAQGVLRITVTRGSGPRGYSPRGAHQPRVFVLFHPGIEPAQQHPGWRLHSSTFVLFHGDALGRRKHGSRMAYVLARAEAELHGFDEALIRSTAEGSPAVECASGNLLWFEGSALVHVADNSPALPGITESIIRTIASRRGLSVRPGRLGSAPSDLAKITGAFVTNSIQGVVPVLSIDAHPLPQDPMTHVLAADLRELMCRECQNPSFG